MPSAAQLHTQQLRLFREQVRKLEPVLDEPGAGEVLFGGTITTHSGRAVAMIAPLRHRPARELVDEGGLVAVLWLTPGSLQSRVERPLRAGVYALRFARERRAARLEFVAPNGRVAHVAKGILMIPRAVDIWEKIKKLLKDLEIDNLLDIEILFAGGKGQPSEIRVSALFFSFHLMDDP